MALEDIFRALEEQAERDVEAVLAEAREHAAVIVDQAQAEAAQVLEHRLAEAERAAISRSSHALNAVRLDARKRVAAVKERAVSDAFDGAIAQLGSVRSSADYPSIFRGLATEALADVEDDFAVLVDPADVELATQVLAEMDLKGEVRGELATAGGLVVMTEGARVARRNTLEDRLGKLRGLAQSDVAEILFA